MDVIAAAWSRAREVGRVAGVDLAPLSTFQDARSVAGLVAQVWGPAELPFSLIRAFQHAGGGMFGARAGVELVGFVLGFGGWLDGPHVHSHMLAVLPAWRARGVGAALKLAQRAACLEQGVPEVRWTYDPLVVRNGWFNLVKLGAVATAVFPGFYGEMTDAINRGDRSDRFEVRWPLSSGRVVGAVSGRLEPPPSDVPTLLLAVGHPDAPRPVATGEDAHGGAVVEVPRDHAALRLADPGLGRAWRDASAEAFETCFAAGLVAAWIDRDGRYVFRPAAEVSA